MPHDPERRTPDHEHRRRDWCAARRPGDTTATFYPGEDLRCPGLKLQPDGSKGPCGAWLDGFKPATDTKVIVRARPHRFDQAAVGCLDKPCRNCGSSLEIRPVLEAAG